MSAPQSPGSPDSPGGTPTPAINPPPRDPSLDVRPDFASTAFAALVSASANASQRSTEDVVDELNACWDAQHDDDVQRWEDHLRALAANTTPTQPMLSAPATDAAAAAPSAVSKTSKLPTFDATLVIDPLSVRPRPSQFALDKLAKHEWFEIYYFTPEACEAAQRDNRANPDTFSLTQSGADGSVTLAPASAGRKLKHVVSDNALTWDQFTIATTEIISHMRRLPQWPPEWVNAYEAFYYTLEHHRLRREDDYGRSVLLEYMARQRRHWYDCIENNEPLFNVAVINSDLLDEVERDLSRRLRKADFESVCLLILLPAFLSF
ncbi:hypothetical protein EIP86_007664 [Pleurotus ostreatoroseus]|nr:hypothetical protein EIP86_007664 [Pleurotus ostreatoroseus]